MILIGLISIDSMIMAENGIAGKFMPRHLEQTMDLEL